MRLMRALLPILMVFVLANCKSSGSMGAAGFGYLQDHGMISTPSPAGYSFCLDYGCQTVRHVSLSDETWAKVAAPLAQPSTDAAAERAAIAATVGLFEAASRRHIAVGRDYAGTYQAALQKDQNDCVDETANTTTLLLMLKSEGLLRRHMVGPPVGRGVFIASDGAPHRSALVAEIGNGDRYVIDSWFRDSGEPADVASLAEWLKGWWPKLQKPA
jgi:hypothetical protein